uniref:TPR_REGION domain-containing protein n=1 Tax=Macrostomum lignano TaxID=282301 RepID=A0A1I8J238_9PLAT
SMLGSASSSTLSTAASAVQRQGASESAAALADFAETAAVICQLLGSDSTADSRSLRYLLADLGLSEDAFALTSVIGQELLAAGHARRAAVCLECALRIGGQEPQTRLRCSVTASLGRAHWLLGRWDTALDCMRRHLKLAESCNDSAEQSRALGNLIAALSALGRSAEALRFERRRLRLCQQDSNSRLSSNSAFEQSTLGRLHTRMDTRNSMLSQRQTGQQNWRNARESESSTESTVSDEAEKLSQTKLQTAQRLEDKEAAAEALGEIGRCQAARGEHRAALRRHSERLSLLNDLRADHHQKSACLKDLVSSCRSLGHWSDALQFARQLADLSTGVNSRIDSLDCLADTLWQS